MLKVSDITVSYGGRTVVDHLSFHLREGQWMMLAGPNGAGKSTLIRAIAQGVPCSGGIHLLGRDIRSFRPAELARNVGVLTQQHSVGYAYTVEEIVSLGRYAHAGGLLAGRDIEGAAHIEQALEATGLKPLRHASMTALSGGEMQRAFLAQVFAQNPRILILDEPANHLDPAYQKHIFSLIQDWVRQPGRAVLCVVHDLSMALQYGTHAVLMDQGRCVAQGAIREALTRRTLERVYGMDIYQWMQDMLGQWV